MEWDALHTSVALDKNSLYVIYCIVLVILCILYIENIHYVYLFFSIFI